DKLEAQNSPLLLALVSAYMEELQRYIQELRNENSILRACIKSYEFRYRHKENSSCLSDG
ncbi:41883_t:CDS:1, partial [Gigaspora margarita]